MKSSVSRYSRSANVLTLGERLLKWLNELMLKSRTKILFKIRHIFKSILKYKFYFHESIFLTNNATKLIQRFQFTKKRLFSCLSIVVHFYTRQYNKLVWNIQGQTEGMVTNNFDINSVIQWESFVIKLHNEYCSNGVMGDWGNVERDNYNW